MDKKQKIPKCFWILFAKHLNTEKNRVVRKSASGMVREYVSLLGIIWCFSLL